MPTKISISMRSIFAWFSIFRRLFVAVNFAIRFLFVCVVSKLLFQIPCVINGNKQFLQPKILNSINVLINNVSMKNMPKTYKIQVMSIITLHYQAFITILDNKLSTDYRIIYRNEGTSTYFITSQ